MGLAGLNRVENIDLPQDEIVDVMTRGMHPAEESACKVGVEEITGQGRSELLIQKGR